MPALPLTIFFSLLLAGLFVALFAREHRQRRFASAERDSLLPLGDEQPKLALASASQNATGPDHDEHDHPHDHDDAGTPCGCRDGSRPPCVGCLRQLNVSSRS